MRKIENLTDKEQRQLEEMRKSDSNYRERDRAASVLLSYRGYRPQEIADIFEVSRRIIYQWFDNYRDFGIEGLETKEGQGRKPILKKNE